MCKVTQLPPTRGQSQDSLQSPHCYPLDILLSFVLKCHLKGEKVEPLSSANVQVHRLDSREDNSPTALRMSAGLTGESPSAELALVLSCKLVVYFTVGGVRSLTGQMGYLYILKVTSVHIFLF